MNVEEFTFNTLSTLSLFQKQSDINLNEIPIFIDKVISLKYRLRNINVVAQFKTPLLDTSHSYKVI